MAERIARQAGAWKDVGLHCGYVTMMRIIQKKAGIDVTGALHVLRHTYCSHLAIAGVPVMEIQRLAGHAHLTTTLKYMHLSPGSEQREAVAKLDQFRLNSPPLDR